jgi:hypothetical protein
MKVILITVMLGRFIAGTVQAQEQCRQSPEYTFEEHSAINSLVLTEYTMDLDVRPFVGIFLPHLYNTPPFLDAGCSYARE